MSPPSLSTLITPPTADQIKQLQLNLLALAAFPVTSWQDGSVPLSMVNADAETISDATKLVATIAASGLLRLAAALPDPEWLDLIAESHYQVFRKPAVITQGNQILTDVGGGGPYTIAPLQLYSVSTNGLRYQNFTGGTLPLNGSLSLLWQAEVAGAAYNLPNNTITQLSTPLPGVAISNPGSLLGDPWITQQGADAESNASLYDRCVQKWATLGGGAPVPVYKYWAVTSTPAVTRVNVLENTPQGGEVTLYLAGSNGSSSSSDVTSVFNYIESVRPLCVGVNVFPASEIAISLTGIVRVMGAYLTSAQAQFVTALTKFSSALDIGGTVYLSQIIGLLQGIQGVINVNMTNPVADLALTSNQVATFSNDLTWISV